MPNWDQAAWEREQSDRQDKQVEVDRRLAYRALAYLMDHRPDLIAGWEAEGCGL